MGWERRGCGRLYYYRVYRTPDGTVTKEYCGRAGRAAAAAAAVARSQAQSAGDRRAVQEERGRLAGPSSLLAELVGVAQLLLEAALLSNGYHRLNYGKWRKRRGDKERTRTTARARSAG
jgi:hypothetical protein